MQLILTNPNIFKTFIGKFFIIFVLALAFCTNSYAKNDSTRRSISLKDNGTIELMSIKFLIRYYDNYILITANSDKPLSNQDLIKKEIEVGGIFLETYNPLIEKNKIIAFLLMQPNSQEQFFLALPFEAVKKLSTRTFTSGDNAPKYLLHDAFKTGKIMKMFPGKGINLDTERTNSLLTIIKEDQFIFGGFEGLLEGDRHPKKITSKSSRNGDFTMNATNPQRMTNATHWTASCDEGGIAGAWIQDDNPNIYCSMGSGFSGASTRCEAGVGVEAAMRKACRSE